MCAPVAWPTGACGPSPLGVVVARVWAFVLLTAMSGYDDPSRLQHMIVYNLNELAIAVWLILGGGGVSKVFWWAQNAGIRKGL